MPVALDTWAMSSISPRVTAASSPVSPVGTTSNSPPPASTTAWARPVSSSAEAKVPGHQLAVEGRVVQRPRRGEADRSRLDRGTDVGRHLGDVGGGGVFVVGAPLAHDVDPQRGVGEERGDVDGVAAPIEGVEVLAEGLPLPLDALVQRRAGDVLDALHQLDQPGLLAGAHRGEAHPAVAGDDGRDAVARRRVEHLVPGGLAVVVGVDVDEAGGDDEPGGVDDLGGVAVHLRRRRRR